MGNGLVNRWDLVSNLLKDAHWRDTPGDLLVVYVFPQGSMYEYTQLAKSDQAWDL